jgi:prolyl oligopeptidase
MYRSSVTPWFILICLIQVPGPLKAQEQNLVYPPTKTVEQVDDFHGTKVEDPYRWLEDDVRTSKDVADWVEAENKLTFDFLKSIPQRETIQKRMTELWNYEKIGAPFLRGGRYYFSSATTGCRIRTCFFRQDTLESEAQVLLDPNSWSAKTARSHCPDLRSATTGVMWPTVCRMPVPTGTPGRSWKSNPAKCWTMN